MRNATPQFKAFLASAKNVFTADLYDIILIDGTTYYYTDADVDVNYGGNLYKSNLVSLQRDKTECAIGTKVTSLNINFAINQSSLIEGSSFISAIRNGVFDGARIILRKFVTDSLVPQEINVVSYPEIDLTVSNNTGAGNGFQIVNLLSSDLVEVNFLSGAYQAWQNSDGYNSTTFLSNGLNVGFYPLSCLRFVGANGSTTFIDDALNTWTATGGCQITTTPTIYGLSCGKFDGTGYLTTPYNPKNDFRAGAFTVRGRFVFDDLSNRQTIISKVSTSSGLQYEYCIWVGDTYTSFYYGIRGDNQSELRIFWPSTLSTGTEYDLEISRDQYGNFRAFCNGALCTTYQFAPLSTDINFGPLTSGLKNNPVDLGNAAIPLMLFATVFGDYFIGKVGGFVVLPYCLHTSSFTPPTVPFGNDPAAMNALSVGQNPIYLTGSTNYSFYLDGNQTMASGGVSISASVTRNINSASGNNGAVIMFAGAVSDAVADRFSGSLSVNSDMQYFDTQIPVEQIQSSCKNQLYGAACTLKKSAFAVTGHVTSGGAASFLTSLTNPDGYFAMGYIVFTSGTSNGLTRFVKQNASGVVSVNVPLQIPCAPGDTFTIYPGCNKTLSTCISKFYNDQNFRGEPYVPDPTIGY